MAFGGGGGSRRSGIADPARVDHLLGSPPAYRLHLWGVAASLVSGAAIAALAYTAAAGGWRLDFPELAVDSGAAASTFALPGAMLVALWWCAGRRRIAFLADAGRGPRQR